MTDDLRRRLRAARPVPGGRDEPISERARHELAELLAQRPQQRSRTTPRRRRGVQWLALAAVLMIAVSVGVFWPTTTVPANAAPQLLDIHPLPEPIGSPVTDLARVAAESSDLGPTGPDVHITMQSWVLRMEEIDGEIVTSPEAAFPEVHDITIREDGSLSTVVTAGEAFGSAPATEVAPETVLWELNQGPGEYQPFFPDPAPVAADEVEGFLSAGSGLEVGASASNAFLAISYLMMEQQLDGPQTAALLTYLSTLPDYKITGSTTDRLDRPALVLSTEREDSQYADQLLIDRETGTILAFETVYIGSTRTDITAPAVTEYHAWEDEQ